VHELTLEAAADRWSAGRQEGRKAGRQEGRKAGRQEGTIWAILRFAMEAAKAVAGQIGNIFQADVSAARN
jgi:predicted transposase YdaD